MTTEDLWKNITYRCSVCKVETFTGTFLESEDGRWWYCDRCYNPQD